MAEKQYKTSNRTKILDFLMKNNNHAVSVKDIDLHLKEVNSPVNVTTIYRYLEKLEKDGNLIKYAADQGDKATYQYVERDHKCDEHLHLKCTECGNVIHLDCAFMDKITEHISHDHGFDIQCRNSVVYGICKECRQKHTKNTEGASK